MGRANGMRRDVPLTLAIIGAKIVPSFAWTLWKSAMLFIKSNLELVLTVSGRKYRP
jgi:hypothetical protein